MILSLYGTNNLHLYVLATLASAMLPTVVTRSGCGNARTPGTKLSTTTNSSLLRLSLLLKLSPSGEHDNGQTHHPAV